MPLGKHKDTIGKVVSHRVDGEIRLPDEAQYVEDRQKTKKGDSNVNMEHVVKVENRVRRVIRDVGDDSLIVEGFFEGYPERILFRVPKRIGTNPINGRIYSRITSIG